MSEQAAGDYGAAQIMAAISAALRESDMRAVVDLLHMLAVKDPASAQMILDAVHVLAAPDSVTAARAVADAAAAASLASVQEDQP